MNAYTVLTEAEISGFIANNPDWWYEAGELKANFKLRDFVAAIGVVNEVAQEAERINHHPSWSNVYNKLSFSFCTHDAGNKITDLDTKMAEFISTSVHKHS